MVWAMPKMLWATGMPRRRVELSSTSSMRREAVWSLATTEVMMARESGGTRSQALKAVISWLRMSLPGWDSR